MKHIGMSLTEDIQHCTLKDHKTFLREIKYLNKWRDVLCAWVKWLNIVKLSFLAKLNYKFYAILRDFFIEIDKTIQKFIENCKGHIE